MTATMLAPTNLREAYEAMAGTPGTIRIQGAGTADTWAGAPLPTDAVLDTTRLTGVLTYNPADLTVAVRAGTPLRELQAELAANGQRVAFDPARVLRGATVGGLIATADSGPLALAYGSMRDLVIGATVVLADGTVARTGGHVIKNVAGYDLAKLLHGSYGNFGLLTEVVLRLHPIPEQTLTVRLDCTLDTGAERAATVLAGALEPVCLEWADGMLLIRVEGTREGAKARAGELARSLSGTVLDEDDAESAWARHAELVDDASVRIGCRPSRLPGVLADCGGAATAGLGTGIGTVTVPDSGIGDVHETVSAAGGTSVTRRRPPEPTPAWGGSPSAISVLRALKDKLDPDRRLSPGRFESWFDGESDGREATS
ncbi:glycolate oxidase FAD binding subunit [Saccharomonospora amisosensis]|uniref:Glycolate oxidase FAD binding subunit n=1 Tax=Saccharomonospora amisosensis TaxID=1128677 RepID=A0A7X5UVY0_9PSEU|nr:FAD-binding protein [Saccharomonospora amisosensis]NIJ14683.1 glycolate oxidase FAD binding subunit [Saccharomonospora amisosensis]